MILAALAASAAAWWTCGRLGWAAVPSSATTLVAAGGAAVAARALLRRSALTLDWDARQWHLTAPGATASGDIAVAMDLGVWLLLRFRPLEAPRRARWIAVERRGHEAHWHALRCALYSPRSAGEPGAVAGDRPDGVSKSKNDRP